ncbi:hypothetical protein D9M72_569810 [compost metagenome]
MAGLAIFAHDALVIVVRGVFRIDIVDIAAFLGGIGRLVDTADPLLLDRNGIDGRHLYRVRSEQTTGQTRRSHHGGGAGSFDQVSSGNGEMEGIAMHEIPL